MLLLLSTVLAGALLYLVANGPAARMPVEVATAPSGAVAAARAPVPAAPALPRVEASATAAGALVLEAARAVGAASQTAQGAQLTRKPAASPSVALPAAAGAAGTPATGVASGPPASPSASPALVAAVVARGAVLTNAPVAAAPLP